MPQPSFLAALVADVLCVSGCACREEEGRKEGREGGRVGRRREQHDYDACSDDDENCVACWRHGKDSIVIKKCASIKRESVAVLGGWVVRVRVCLINRNMNIQ